MLPEAGHVPVKQVFFADREGWHVLTEKPCNSTSSSGTENERLGSLLNRKIQRRLRQQREVHKIDKELGDMMRLFRTNTGMTLAALAYSLNLPFKYLYDIEQGVRSANLLDLCTIFSAYGIELAPTIIDFKKANHPSSA